MTSVSGCKRFDLFQTLDYHYLKLPVAALHECGPATQTLGALLRISQRETFVAVNGIATRARLPLATVRKHLKKLVESKWIIKVGRQKSASGRARRTCTYVIADKTLAAADHYLMLPWWAYCAFNGNQRLSWSAKAVLAFLMSKLAYLKKASAETGADYQTLNDMAERCTFYDSTFGLSLRKLAENTGLNVTSVIAGKRVLNRLGIIEWSRNSTDTGGDSADSLTLRPDFFVKVTPTTPGYCRIDFECE